MVSQTNQNISGERPQDERSKGTLVKRHIADERLPARRLRVKDADQFGSIDAGFFFHGGRYLGCAVAIVLLFLPLVTLLYGLWAIFSQVPDYEWSFLPLSWLRNATAFAIVVFAPLLPFRLWLLVSAIDNEKAVDRAIAQEDSGNGDKHRNSPSWGLLAPELYNYRLPPTEDNPSNSDKEGLSQVTADTMRHLKLSHMLIQKKNHANVLGYRDIQDIETKLMGKDWVDEHNNTDHSECDDNYLVMVGLFKESGAMERLTKSLSRLKYKATTEDKRYLRLLLLLEESEHGSTKKWDENKQVRYTHRSEHVIKDFEGKLKEKGKKKNKSSSKNITEFMITTVTGFLRVILRLIAYIVTPIVAYKWFTEGMSKKALGDPNEYAPNPQQDRPALHIKETTYQAAIRNILALPDPMGDETSITDIRQSFVIAFVPSTSNLGKTNRQEAQTKPRALNYGIYERFTLPKHNTDNLDSTKNWTSKTAIRVRPFKIQKTQDGNTCRKEYRDLTKLVELLKRLKYLTENYHHVLMDIEPYQNGDKIDWRKNFRTKYHLDFDDFKDEVLGIFDERDLVIVKKDENRKEFYQKIQQIRADLLNVFAKAKFRDTDYQRFQIDIMRVLQRCSKEFEEMREGRKRYSNCVYKNIQAKISELLDKKRADFDKFCNTVNDILMLDIRTDTKIDEAMHDEKQYLGAYLLRMMTGYHDYYAAGKELDPDTAVDQLALLCMSEETIKTWGLLAKLFNEHLNYLCPDEKRDKNPRINPQDTKKRQSILLPVFVDMDYRYNQKTQRSPEAKCDVDTSKRDWWKPDYCTVYDAEDRPEEDQLLKAVYTHKFYEYMPLLMLDILGRSLEARAYHMAAYVKAENNMLSEKVKWICYSKREGITNRAEKLLGKTKDCKELILELRRLTPDIDLAEKRSEYTQQLHEIIDDARKLHRDLQVIEKTNTPLVWLLYYYLYKSPVDMKDKKRNERIDYFWYRAGLYLYEFLEDVQHNDWQQYLNKAYPLEVVDTGDKDQEMRAYDNRVVCLQAKLTYENLNDNWLISLFKADYASWFNYLLPGLHVHNLPIPLGGTSNHFKMGFLSHVGGWDGFNVAEDCDLGMWIARAGKRVAIVESNTWEIANPSMKAWISQRSRWVKGYMQSYFVHMRHPLALWNELGGFKGFASFQLTVGSGFLLPMLAASFYVMTLIYIISLLAITIGSIFQAPFALATPLFFISDIHYHWILPIGTGSLFISNVIFFIVLLIGQLRHPKPGKMQHIIFWWYLYWIIMVIASWRALYEYIFDPFHWELSDHSYLK